MSPRCIKFKGFDIAEKEQYYILPKARDDEANQRYLTTFGDFRPARSGASRPTLTME